MAEFDFEEPLIELSSIPIIKTTIKQELTREIKNINPEFIQNNVIVCMINRLFSERLRFLCRESPFYKSAISFLFGFEKVNRASRMQNIIVPFANESVSANFTFDSSIARNIVEKLFENVYPWNRSFSTLCKELNKKSFIWVSSLYDQADKSTLIKRKSKSTVPVVLRMPQTSSSIKLKVFDLKEKNETFHRLIFVCRFWDATNQQYMRTVHTALYSMHMELNTKTHSISLKYSVPLYTYEFSENTPRKKVFRTYDEKVMFQVVIAHMSKGLCCLQGSIVLDKTKTKENRLLGKTEVRVLTDDTAKTIQELQNIYTKKNIAQYFDIQSHCADFDYDDKIRFNIVRCVKLFNWKLMQELWDQHIKCAHND